ncbi:MAG: OmpH family outer membrane protein [Bacteroidota bacterium]
MNKFFLSIVLCVFASTFAGAQDKYGHLNFGNVVALMPETAKADADMETYRKELVSQGEGMVKAFQDKYGKLIADQQSGNFTPKQLQERAQALSQEEQQIAAFEQEVAKKVEAKRQELLQPIIKKAEDAIQAIGKANGYKLIFDTSVFNSVLFAQDSDDVFPLVKAKLNLKEPPTAKQ